VLIEPAPAAPGGDEPPVMPAPEKEKPDTLRSESRKPVFPAPAPRIRTAATRNVLYGMVESSTAGEPEEGVPVTLTSVSQTGTSRVTLTNAFGKFAIRVPDGTYDVLVTMPSGRKHVIDGPLGRINVKNGLITDQEGHDIPSVIITR
jgi:hypothetical protein